jgi:hypothetical protein
LSAATTTDNQSSEQSCPAWAIVGDGVEEVSGASVDGEDEVD